MNVSYQSPKNCKKTDPLDYGYYENVKERHYLGKYNPNKNDIGFYNSKYTPEIETFNFFNHNNKSNSMNSMNANDDKDKFNYNEYNKVTFAIKSTII